MAKLIGGAALIAVQPASAHFAPRDSHTAEPAENPQDDAVRAVLSRYKSAIERLDPAGTELLFTTDSTIFETGGAEGSYANYLTHHLGPELKEVKSFAFSDYKVDVRFEGPVALATETYDYRIVLKSGTVVERRGVATSVLRRENGQWKIVSMHNSARQPRRP
mgnify:FL=1